MIILKLKQDTLKQKETRFICPVKKYNWALISSQWVT